MSSIDATNDEQKMSTYQYLKSIGICPVCKKERIYGDESVCVECLAKKYSYYHNVFKNNPKMIENKRKSSLERYKRLKENGICVGCGKNQAVNGKTQCNLCLSKNVNVKIKNIKNL